MRTLSGMLARSNIRKRKSAAISLMTLIALTVMLLSTGLSVGLRLSSFQQEKLKELKAPDIISYYKDNDQAERYQTLAKEYPAAVQVDEEPALLMSARKIPYNGSEVMASMMILLLDRERSMAPFTALPGAEFSDTEPVVYLPYTFRLGGGYKIGQLIAFSNDGPAAYRVGGFFEEPLNGTLTNSAVKVHANAAAYEQLQQELGEQSRFRYLSVSLADPEASTPGFKRLLTERLSAERTGQGADGFIVMDAESAMTGNGVIVTMLAAILIVFSSLLTLISLVVIRFQIQVQMDDYMKDIGVLKANGYTSSLIRRSVSLQYFLVSLMGMVPGLAASAAITPVTADMISGSMGLRWPSGLPLSAGALALLIILALVSTVAAVSSKRVRRITPIQALQNGLNPHNFKRNPLPLAGLRLPLAPGLGLKLFFQQTRQNMLLFVVASGLTFSSVFCGILNYNMAGDSKEVINLVGLERSSARLTSRTGSIPEERYRELAAIDGVKGLALLEEKSATVSADSITMNISPDYSLLRTKTVYKGRYPQYDNEIALSAVVAKKAGKQPGDEVEISLNGVVKRYLVTGLTQQITQLGMVASVTDSRFRRLAPDYVPATVHVYLEDSVPPEQFARTLEVKYPGQWSILNMEEWLQGTLNTFTSTFSAITWSVSGVTVVVVGLILFTIIRTLIMKRKRELGIMKGLGYRSFHLMQQIAFSLLPVVAAGVLTGLLTGAFYSGELFILLLSSLGIHNASFTASVPQILLLGAGLMAASYGICMLASWKIHSIHAYQLISE